MGERGLVLGGEGILNTPQQDLQDSGKGMLGQYVQEAPSPHLLLVTLQLLHSMLFTQLSAPRNPQDPLLASGEKKERSSSVHREFLGWGWAWGIPDAPRGEHCWQSPG